MSPDFFFTVRHTPHAYVVTLYGELDLACADGLAVRLSGLADSDIVVDLLGLTLLDSRGAVALMMARDRIAERGRYRFVLTRPAGIVRTVLQLTGLTPLVDEWSSDWAYGAALATQSHTSRRLTAP